jgi:hypothetical protein
MVSPVPPWQGNSVECSPRPRPVLVKQHGPQSLAFRRKFFMTAEHHVEEHTANADLFSAAEWNAFRASDAKAAAAIVVLMQGIFVIGVVLYLVVLLTL